MRRWPAPSGGGVIRAMTKSAVRLAGVALAVGAESQPRYAARTSHHDYT